jgi:hypothetical protein
LQVDFEIIEGILPGGKDRVRKRIMHRHIVIYILAGLLIVPVASAFQTAPAGAPPKGPPQWPPQGDFKWPDWAEEATKRIEKSKALGQTGPEAEFLQSTAAELLERAKASRENFPRFERFISATNALLEANDRIVWLRKVDRGTQPKDYWGAGFMLPGWYFRVRQAEFFASLSSEKNLNAYVTWAKSLYQQSRSAYDAHEYQRARLLGDASSFIVFALECIAQATVQMPEAPVTK